MRSIFRGGIAQASEINPSPKFASLRYANCRPSLKGRVGMMLATLILVATSAHAADYFPPAR